MFSDEKLSKSSINTTIKVEVDSRDLSTLIEKLDMKTFYLKSEKNDKFNVMGTYEQFNVKVEFDDKNFEQRFTIIALINIYGEIDISSFRKIYEQASLNIRIRVKNIEYMIY